MSFSARLISSSFTKIFTSVWILSLFIVGYQHKAEQNNIEMCCFCVSTIYSIQNCFVIVMHGAVWTNADALSTQYSVNPHAVSIEQLSVCTILQIHC